MQNGVCSAYCIGKGGRDTRDCNMNAHRIHIAADYRKANQAEYKRKKRKTVDNSTFLRFSASRRAWDSNPRTGHPA